MNILEKAKTSKNGFQYDTGKRLPPQLLDYVKETGFFVFGAGISCPTPRRWKPERTLPGYGIIHMVGGSGEFVTPGNLPVRLYPGMVVCHSPTFRHDVHALNDDDPFMEDYVGVSGPLIELWHKCGLFRDGLFYLSKVRHVALIAELLLKHDIISQTEAIIRTQALFMEILKHPYEQEEKGKNIFCELGESITANLKLDWSVSEMADYCSMTPNTFRIKFKQYTGRSPKLYLDRLRMRRVEELLAVKGSTLEDIAQAVGYSCAFHLSRRFKEITGITPSDFRSMYL